MAEPLPFICDECGERFGFGPDIALLAVFTEVPFSEKSPCCGNLLVGTMRREDDRCVPEFERGAHAA